MTQETLPWLILWLPFAASLVIALFLRRLPKLAGILATGTLLAGFALSLALFKSAASFESSIIWIPLDRLPVEFGVMVNPLSLLMLLIVTGIGSLIFLYSTAYMEHDESCGRYFASLSLFAFSMLGIVLSNNLIQIFIFWELVGVSSYLLIGFWFQKPEASTAGKKAFITTRVGDVGMMIGILMLFGFLAQTGSGTFNFIKLKELFTAGVPFIQTEGGHSIPAAIPLNIPASAMTAIALLIFLGVAGKSAQVPLHVWLPDAMEGPTPVSALIHAATMVAAGVFLLTRLDFLFNASPDALHVIAWTGGITALLAGTIAIVQNDIKKILAYSTLSQLGYMVLALGLGNAGAGMFHLTTHAFFKALLFLGAGSLIHALHTQDIWDMPDEKGLLKSMPVTSWTFLIGTAALMGIPPFSGFFSKEAVLAAAFHGPKLLLFFAMLTVLCTSFYMGRLCTLVFFRRAHELHGRHSAHESGWPMALPLIILAVFSIGAGFLPIPGFLGFHAEHEGGGIIQVLSIILAVSGFILAFVIFRGRQPQPLQNFWAEVLEKKYFFDDFYDTVVIKGIQESLGAASDWFERKVVVEQGANGTARLTRSLGNLLRKLQTGAVQFYALVFSIGVTLLLYALILWKK